MLTVKGYFENGAIRLPDEVKDRQPGPVLVTFLEEKELGNDKGLLRFVEGRQRTLDSTVIPRKDAERHKKDRTARESNDTQAILRPDLD